MDAALLTALADPNRLRIVELLNVAPRAVGEIATKHLGTTNLNTVFPGYAGGTAKFRGVLG